MHASTSKTATLKKKIIAGAQMFFFSITRKQLGRFIQKAMSCLPAFAHVLAIRVTP